MRVAVCHRVSEDGTILAHIYEVASPGIDTDALDGDATLSHELQALDDFEVEGIDVPIEVTACFDEVVIEASQFFQVEFSIR